MTYHTRWAKWRKKQKSPAFPQTIKYKTFAYEYEMSSQTKNETLAFIFTDKTTWVLMRCSAKTGSTVSVWNWREKHAERTFYFS